MKISNRRLLDLEPIPQDVRFQCWATHSVYLVSLDSDELSLTPIDFEWLRVGTEKQRLKIPVTEGDTGFADRGPLTVMLSTAELRKFVTKYADDKEAFKPNDHFVFRKK